MLNFLILSFALLLIISVLNTTVIGQQEPVTEEQITEEIYSNIPTVDMNKSKFISVDIFADRKEYTEFEDIKILVPVQGNASELIKLVLETRNASNTVVHKASQIVNTNNISKFYLHPANKGTYNVTVKAIQGNSSETAFTMFKITSIFTTNILKFLYLSLGFFGALLILITIGKKNRLIDEIMRFVFLSGIVASILASLLFTDLEFGTQSPIGLIKLEPNEENIEEWVFNIGNVLRVPIYVMVFGLIGGYIRYLYKTSKLIDEVKEKINKSKSQTSGDSLNDKNTQIEGTKNLQIESQDRMAIFYESLKDIAFFSLAPLLAIAVYFLLFAFGLSGDNAIYTQAVISFSIGLVTEDVIRTLIRFTQERLSDNNSKSNDK